MMIKKIIIMIIILIMIIMVIIMIMTIIVPTFEENAELLCLVWFFYSVNFC